MATLNYPAGLSQTPRLGFTVVPRQNYLEDPREAGAAQRRPLSTAGFEDFDGEIYYSDADFQTLRTFFFNSAGDAPAGCSWGTAYFNFTHPVTGSTVDARFREQPAYRGVTPTGGWVRLALELKVTP